MAHRCGSTWWGNATPNDGSLIRLKVGSLSIRCALGLFMYGWSFTLSSLHSLQRMLKGLVDGDSITLQ